jgi:phosphatidate cytidylyltransferase
MAERMSTARGVAPAAAERGSVGAGRGPSGGAVLEVAEESGRAATRPAPRVSELVKRVLFAAVAGPLTVLLVRAGGVPLALLLAAASGVAAWELFRIARAGGTNPLSPVGVPIAAAIPLLIASEPRGVFDAPPWFIAGVLLVVFTAAIWARGAEGHPLAAVAVTLFGIAYTGGLLSFAEAIRNHRFVADDASGTALLLLPLFLTWANDIGAYASGRLFGRRKLLPAVSPGKTVAGAVGGLVASLALTWVYVHSVLHSVAQLSMSPRNLAVFAIVVCAAGQIGDLAESLLKREAGVKDSSGIFPGHGGVLDRIDSLLFVLPVAWMLFGLPGFLVPAPSP